MGQNRCNDEVAASAFFDPDRNCWRVRQAERLTLVVDGQNYFAALRQVFRQARRELLLIGWDFDFEMEMLPGESDDDGNAPDGLPNQVGAFLEAVVEQSLDLHVYILKWNGAIMQRPAVCCRLWRCTSYQQRPNSFRVGRTSPIRCLPPPEDHRGRQRFRVLRRHRRDGKPLGHDRPSSR